MALSAWCAVARLPTCSTAAGCDAKNLNCLRCESAAVDAAFLLRVASAVHAPFQLSKLHGDDLDEEQREGVRPVLVVHADGRDQAAVPPQHLQWSGWESGSTNTGGVSFLQRCMMSGLHKSRGHALSMPVI